jgi:rhodanese-related sulfurtransferase
MTLLTQGSGAGGLGKEVSAVSTVSRVRTLARNASAHRLMSRFQHQAPTTRLALAYRRGEDVEACAQLHRASGGARTADRRIGGPTCAILIAESAAWNGCCNRHRPGAKSSAFVLACPVRTDVRPRLVSCAFNASVVRARRRWKSKQDLQKIEDLAEGDRNRPIVTASWNSERWSSRNLAIRLVSLGYHKVYWYRGGLEAWDLAGLSKQLVHD